MKQEFKPGDLVWKKEYGSWWQAKVVLVENRHAFVIEVYETHAQRVPPRRLRQR